MRAEGEGFAPDLIFLKELGLHMRVVWMVAQEYKEALQTHKTVVP